ncbi:MAG: 16S rRNA (guanine(527)-N(7))-methyltransferase RsmG [Chloroflexota bacterium]
MELLERGARALGLALTPAQHEAFAIYLHELLAWNQRFNLTTIVDPEEVQTRHFLDSLTCLLAMAPHTHEGSLAIGDLSGRAIDIGAGAGFPGLPLAIVAPQLRWTLLESVGKKATFLEHMKTALGLTGVEVVVARAEDLARQPGRRDTYDYAVARALAPLPVLAEYCLPFLRPGGRLVAPKKGNIAPELASGRRAIAALGGRWREPLAVPLAIFPDARFLVLADKIKLTPSLYPRRAGTPAKQPLGG